MTEAPPDAGRPAAGTAGMSGYDIAIIGAGIAGAGLAQALMARAPTLRLLVLEAEATPGYHTTGRSAAFFAETYGGPDIQPLSSASRAFLESPPADIADHGFLSDRGALHLLPPGGDRALLDSQRALFADHGIAHELLGPEAIRQRVPWLRPEWTEGAVWEPGCADIDVAGLHQALLRHARRAGTTLVTDARVTGLSRGADGWAIATAAGAFAARRIVDAAGAWADDIAALAGAAPLGLVPLRRTIVVAETDPPAPADLPIVMDLGGSFYFRPDGGRLWLSPHDETPDVAQDVQPDELDIAITLDRFEHVCDWPVRRLGARWAGLRTFAPDRLPVLGPDPLVPDFFWCAGQGGWGIQTAPAASDLAAALVLGQSPPLDPALYRPSRFG
jgi:D-arginine dehydrogenase